MVIAMVVLMFFLLFLGVPVAFAIGLPCLGLLVTSVPLPVVPQIMTGAVNSFTLMAIPLFLLAGTLMNTSGITDRIFKFAMACVGHVKGGLGHVNVLASLIFAGMSGSAVADTAGLGTIEIKAMNDEGTCLWRPSSSFRSSG